MGDADVCHQDGSVVNDPGDEQPDVPDALLALSLAYRDLMAQDLHDTARVEDRALKVARLATQVATEARPRA